MNVERDAVPGRLVVTRPLPFSIRVERGRHAVTVETGPVHRRTILLGLRRVSAELEVLEHIASDDRDGDVEVPSTPKDDPAQRVRVVVRMGEDGGEPRRYLDETDTMP
jgi:hypothetical protein